MKKLIQLKVPIKFYIGKEGFIKTCNRSLEFAQNEILFLGDIKTWYENKEIQDYDIKYYIPKRLKKGISLKMISPKTDRAERMEEKDSLENRSTKLLDSNIKLQSIIIIYGDEVSITISKRPYLGIIIQHESIASSFRSIFELLWEKI